jgi:5-(carboxyamino)imidazole ribonucleotide mutase
MSAADQTNVRVGVVMGSRSDWETMQRAADVLNEFGVEHEVQVMSAHRTPDVAAEYARSAEARGLCAIIAGAGMAAHLAGALAANTTVPVLGVPVASGPLNGFDALLSTVQMPPGVPVATFAIGPAGAANAAHFAVELLAARDASVREKLAAYRRKQAEAASAPIDPRTTA